MSGRPRGVEPDQRRRDGEGTQRPTHVRPQGGFSDLLEGPQLAPRGGGHERPVRSESSPRLDNVRAGDVHGPRSGWRHGAVPIARAHSLFTPRLRASARLFGPLVHSLVHSLVHWSINSSV